MKGKKTGGRQAGTPNKVTRQVKECLSSLLIDYTNDEKFKDDFYKLSPKDRLMLAEKLMPYVVPKLQNTAVDISTEGKKTIEDTLIALSRAPKDDEDDEEEDE